MTECKCTYKSPTIKAELVKWKETFETALEQRINALSQRRRHRRRRRIRPKNDEIIFRVLNETIWNIPHH